VPPPRRFVAAHEDVVGRVEEEDALGDADALQLVERGGEIREEVARTDVDHQRVPRRRLLPARELGDLADQHGRQVVDDEVAEIFEHVRGLGATGAGHPGHDRHIEASTHAATTFVAPSPCAPS
jgi:hypothetical protein